ncbi:A24 family peptidase [Pelagibius sp. 7325]|uniref:prepilin peptidase n=1 Tax=Pelagibius sp. 7325 TaxID=3131994 RepID=UPI0030ECA3B7
MAASFHHIAALVVAPFIGSFLSVLVVRLPAAAPVALSRSRCPSCHHVLRALDLLPLASRLLLGGRCRHCRGAISLLYPALELAALAVALAAVAMTDGSALWMSCLLGWTLLALAAIDLRDYLLPDVLTLPLLLAGLAATAVLDAGALQDHLIGAVLGFSSFYGVSRLYRLLRACEGLGLGDAKLLAAAGAWLGWTALPSVLLIAAAAALAVAAAARIMGRPMQSTTPLPFGSFLAFSIWWVWLYGALVI